MKPKHALRVAVALTFMAACHGALAECAIAEEAKQLDPVEVGFCESDAVFVGKVESRLETVRAFTPEGSARTMHYRIEASTVRVLTRYKGKTPDQVSMTADLYDKKSGAFSFQNGEEYLVFAKRLADSDEYAGASAACSVQPTLPIAEARKALERLEQHRKGSKRIDCNNIRAKAQAQ